ncbi:hypothetical protein PIB30_054859 [Stylosanthes scabra]|uniref:Retrotransposon gag domain-containing protein n=1 Tax=Stylosanthes scabra TaxID=79078 RepID=A0ABU6UHX6_9FABA|nr:hypothetical protein [Stylosanthes scabra]
MEEKKSTSPQILPSAFLGRNILSHSFSLSVLSHTKVFGPLFGTPVLNIGAICGELDFRTESGEESGTSEPKMVDTQHNNEHVDENDIPLFTPEKGMIPPNQKIQQMEAALKKLFERQTREAAIASEAMERAEAIAARQQALLEEAEKREREWKTRSNNRPPDTEDTSKMVDSQVHTWKPSVAISSQPPKENSKQPFSLAILWEELPEKFKYPVDMEPYDGTSDPKHHLDVFDNRMVLLNASDVVKCKAFTVTLKKDVLTWFNSLSPGSIKSFSELFESFFERLHHSKKASKDMSESLLDRAEAGRISPEISRPIQY